VKKIPGSITIRDVAQLAKVSPATVSKVLNRAPNVSEVTRARVLDAVDKLNYRPNTIARSLRKNHTATIGLITDDIEGVFTMSMMRGIVDAASEQGFSAFLFNTYKDMAREKTYLEILLDKQVDGVVLMSGYRVRQRGAPALSVGDTPVVYLYQYTHDLPVPCVIPDDYSGGVLATQYLIERGCQRIGLISGPLHYEASLLRLDGYKYALQEAGLPFDPALVRDGKWHEDSGYYMASELLDQPRPPDALFCASDSLAVGALDAAQRRGLRVPDDLALIGFDNRVFAAHQRPPLTTVALPLYEMGELAAGLLLAGIRKQAPEAQIHRVPCTLIQRQSC
jgi:LacI family transcriptional regulator